ncbi:hypothetical protein [Erysipelothrix sp. HDW6B]|nr:hypothetical protein [Erysipelothrix sp. HDW6B]
MINAMITISTVMVTIQTGATILLAYAVIKWLKEMWTNDEA